MKKLKYVYDPRKQVMMVFRDGHNIGGYMGQIAERKFESLLLTGVVIELAEFLTRSERSQRELSKPNKP